MATELADFDEQLDEIITEHKVKKSKEKRLQRKKELKQQNIEKINSLKNEKLIRKSNQTFVEQIVKLFDEDYFCDLIIECDHLFKYLHSCILIARVPVLFELLKERFAVGNDTSLVPVFDCSTAHSNPLYDNSYNDCLNNNGDSRADEQQQERIIDPYFLHIRLPPELSKVFNLIGFLQNVYSQDCVEHDELELILILNKIKVLEDQNLFSLDNLLNLDCSIQVLDDRPMNERLTELNGLDDCKKMKVRDEEPLYINLEDDKLVNSKLRSSCDEDARTTQGDQLNDEQPKADSLKKGKTFLLSKVNIENEQFEINLLNDEDNDIVNKLANIDNEIKEMEHQIDAAVEKDKLCADPENEERQLISALSNERIEINACPINEDDDLYGNIKQQPPKDNTDTVSEVSEICDEFSVTAGELGEAAKYSDSLEVRTIGDIELNFKQEEDTVNDRNSLFYDLINIESKVQKVTNDPTTGEKHILIENNETYSSYENDLEEDKTLSASMVRSDTFNLRTPIAETKLKSDLIKTRLTESEDDSSLGRRMEQDSLMSNPKPKSSPKRSNTKLINKSQSADQYDKFTKKSLQYFLDETQIVAKQQEIDEMERSLTNARQSSGLFFIDLEDPRLNSGMSKSSTFDRKRSKLNQKAMSESNESSLNSSFIDDKKATQPKDTGLPMSMIIRKDNHHATNDGMFRLGNHFRTLSGGTPSNRSSRQSTSASTLRNTQCSSLKKTRSEITTNTTIVQKEANEDNEQITRSRLFSCTRLGEDLLKMFVNQINCDFSLLVCDKAQPLRAHKCILMARSEFFAKKFFNNLECNQINLVDFSYDSVHFVLCHIYSGTINIPNFNNEEHSKSMASNDGYQNLNLEYGELNLAELLSLSDLFQLSILKDVILFELKKNYCHHFHKPCNDCITGVINCLHLAQKVELPSLYNCCLSWICRNYKKVWPTKQFATLFTQPSVTQNSPRHNHKSRIHQPIHKNNEIINSIHSAVLDGLTNDNVIDRILNLQQLASSITRLKWNEMIIQLIEELIEDCCKYLATNYDAIVSSQKFIQLGLDKSWQLDILESYLIKAVDSMKCETAIRVFMHLENIVIMCDAVNETGGGGNLGNGERSSHIYANTTSKSQFSDEFLRTVQRLYKSIERYLIHNANEAVYCESWPELSPNIQQYIKSSAVLVFEFEKPLSKRPVLSSSLMKSSSRQSSADTKATSSVKRRNSDKLKSKKSTEDDQSRQSTLTRRSAQKGSKSVKDDQTTENYDESHIYDEVPVDLVNEIKEKKECTVEYAKAIKKPQNTQQPQVAKVSPFTVLDMNMSNIATSLISSNYENYEELDAENNYENIIYDESIALQKVGSESSLASSCLHEAETLEENLEELTRKVQNQRVNALRQCRQQQANNKKASNMTGAQNVGSPVLRTSQRAGSNRQQSANSISSNSAISSASSNRTKATTRTSNHKKPPFK